MKKYTFKIDGYNVGDRLLEGVDFNVVVEETDGYFSVGEVQVDPASSSYFERLNKQMWLDEVRKRANHVLNDLVAYSNKQGGEPVENVLTDLDDDGYLQW